MIDFATLQENMGRNREFYIAGGRYSVVARRNMLKRLHDCVLRYHGRICSALYDDLGKSEFEADVTEIIPFLESLKFLSGNLSSLAADKRVGVSLFNWPGSGRLVPEPYGQVLIIGTWNYPFLLALDPLIGALAAGNRVVLKLSPQSPATSQLLDELLTEAFPGPEVWVADRNVTPAMLAAEKFDYIFFTGGSRAGKEILKLAAENFTPVTLEMGGKSPCIVDENANLKVAARRIVWGKFLNCGQTCVAPDYLLVHNKVKDKLTNEIHDCVRAFFGDDPSECRDYPRIVNDTHFQRLEPLLERGRLITGGEKNRRKLYIAPTVIDQLSWDDPVMNEEIFGPILPVFTINSMDEAVSLVNRRAKPLALYYFGGMRNRSRIIRSISAGGMCVNDTIMHLANPSMPFGGVGASGMGAYHGKYSFATFTHYKPVLSKPTWFDPPLRYVPFTAWKRFVAKFFVNKSIRREQR